MKKILLLAAAVLTAMSMMAQRPGGGGGGGQTTETTFYVAGSGSAGNPWCDGIWWEANGSQMTGTPPSITFYGVPAGVYDFKVTNGTWSQDWGWSSLAESSRVPGVSVRDGNNIAFILGGTADITITFNGTQITLTSSIGFGEAVEITVYSVVGDEGLTGADWVPSNTAGDMTLIGGVWVKTFTNIAAGFYEFKIVGNHSYNVFEFPEGDGNNEIVEVWEDGSNVKITFDPATGIVTAEVVTEVSINNPSVDGIQLSAANGTIYCSADSFVIYNTAGVDVTAQNGNLKGVFIVKYNGKAATIIVK